MLLTRESDYAIRIVRALRLGDKRAVKHICAEEEIPEPFTYKILKKLEKAGIAKAVRGAQGGYILYQSIEDLTLIDIIRAIDPQFAITQCTIDGYDCNRHKQLEPCAVHDELVRIQELLIKELQTKSLADLFEL
ncbi:MAG: Rrf2 family transcriptional regulator [Lachnospiraceae bacterium]